MTSLINEILEYYFNKFPDRDTYISCILHLKNNSKKSRDKEYWRDVLIGIYHCPECGAILGAKTHSVIHMEVDTGQYEERVYSLCNQCGWNDLEE